MNIHTSVVPVALFPGSQRSKVKRWCFFELFVHQLFSRGSPHRKKWRDSTLQTPGKGEEAVQDKERSWRNAIRHNAVMT